jgi:hypothetical protein
LGVNLVWQRKKDELFPAVGERGDNFWAANWWGISYYAWFAEDELLYSQWETCRFILHIVRGFLYTQIHANSSHPAEKCHSSYLEGYLGLAMDGTRCEFGC